MGQWENLEKLAASVGVTQSPGASSASSPPGGSCTSSPFWALRAEAAWRHREWAEVFSALAGVSCRKPMSLSLGLVV